MYSEVVIYYIIYLIVMKVIVEKFLKGNFRFKI